jgi:excisionase family DNA binding protein
MGGYGRGMSAAQFTLPEAARALGIPLDEALRLVEQSKLPAARGWDGGVYVRREDLDTYRQATSAC